MDQQPACQHQGRRDAGPTLAKLISAPIRPFLGDQHRAPLGAESASKQGLQRQMRLHAGGPEVVFAPEITQFGRELETADAVRRQTSGPDALHRSHTMPGGLGHGAPVQGGRLVRLRSAPRETRHPTSHFGLGTAISLYAIGTARAWPELVCRSASGDG